MCDLYFHNVKFSTRSCIIDRLRTASTIIGSIDCRRISCDQIVKVGFRLVPETKFTVIDVTCLKSALQTV